MYAGVLVIRWGQSVVLLQPLPCDCRRAWDTSAYVACLASCCSLVLDTTRFRELMSIAFRTVGCPDALLLLLKRGAVYIAGTKSKDSFVLVIHTDKCVLGVLYDASGVA